MYIFIVLFR